MPTERLYIVGAGGHAKVVLDALTLSVPQRAVIVVDEDEQRTGQLILGHTVLHYPLPETLGGRDFHLAIGHAATRNRMHKILVAVGARAVTIRHPAASIAASALIGDGCFIAAQSVVAPSARVGAHVIANHGAIIDHDCEVGDFCHIAPNATLGGGAIIGASVLIGAGATILPGVRIGDGATIAAGATIVRDVAPGETVIFAMVRKQQVSA
ncbi:acetyltransferase [Sphingomonas sp. C3-2]|uniref:acetyltransferase n=1 Tax=Sphingomonas sp. C3-2 TaxID=3062169 RepID=UPI00294B067E|nr:acetyltransferase [Sphingomonas sp. C3-2]WOK35109.1 acetyltransferase [Sphingomonas sp. C3-2]